MKVNQTKIKPDFSPVSVEVVLESKQELSEFYSLCNHLCISTACPHLDFTLIRRALRLAFGKSRDIQYSKSFILLHDTIVNYSGK